MEKTVARDDLLNLIGNPTNDDLRRLSRLLTWYKYSDEELKLIHAMVLKAVPSRRGRKIEDFEE